MQGCNDYARRECEKCTSWIMCWQKMCDEYALNIKFVKCIEQYPCLYDFTRDDHRKRNVTEMAYRVQLVQKVF